MGFPLNPATAGDERKAEPCQGHCHQMLLGHPPFVRQLRKRPTLPKTIIWAVPAPAKAEVLFSGVGAKQRLLAECSFLPRLLKKKTQCDYVINVSFLPHTHCVMPGPPEHQAAGAPEALRHLARSPDRLGVVGNTGFRSHSTLLVVWL